MKQFFPVVLGLVVACLWMGAVHGQRAGDAKGRHVLFVAGPDSHGWGQHKHYAGCMILAESLGKASAGVTTEVVREWPSAEGLERADALVIYADGWEKHPANGKLDVLERFMDAGKGIVVLHWATGIGVADMKQTDQSGDPVRARWRKLVGADFEPFYSVSRVWTSDFAEPAEHAVTRGVKPFALYDECYFHLRAVDGGPTRLLEGLPPAGIIGKKVHRGQGNPQARAAVAERKEPQFMAWAYDRPAGGRAFGWSGGHFHWTWARDEARLMALNAIAWAAGAEVPEGGLRSPRPDAETMMENLTGENPGWTTEALQKALDLAGKGIVVPWKAFDKKPLEAKSTLALFDGKSLRGWQVNKGEEKWWRVKDGVIEGGSLEEHVPHNTFLTTTSSYQNFELRLKMKITPVKGGVNSGIQIRSVRVPDHHEMIGYQADAGGNWWGKLYDESRRRKVIGESQDAEAVKKAVKPTGWNDYRIRCEGPRIRTWLNGVAAVDYTEEDGKIPLAGKIGLQVHGGGTLTVQFKDIELDLLRRDPAAPSWEGLSRQPWPKPQRPPAKPPAKPAAGKAEKPNVVVIFIDDMGYGDIGPFGSTRNETPHLDRMAKEGRVLTSFYVAAPVCTPSRAALMTACYPKRVGLAVGSGHAVLFPGDVHGLHPDEWTMAEMFKDAGYATGCFGKWHLGDQAQFLPTAQGFDIYYGIPYSNDMWPGHNGWRFPDLPVMRGTEVVSLVKTMDEQADLCRQFTEEAVKFIRAHKARSTSSGEPKPFFVYLPHAFVHGPRAARPEFMAKAKDETEAQIEEVDWSVGEILGALREEGIAKKTLVLFTSDNGGARGCVNRPLRGGKGSAFEGGMREPTVVWWPGTIPAGTKSDEILTAMDLLPTFAKLAGGKLGGKKIDGKDIGPVLLGMDGAKSPHQHFFYHQRETLQAVRSGKWKYFRAGQLYDLEADIGEKTNVAAKQAQVVARLTMALDDFEAYVAKTSRPVGVAENTRTLVPRPGVEGDEGYTPTLSLGANKKKR